MMTVTRNHIGFAVHDGRRLLFVANHAQTIASWLAFSAPGEPIQWNISAPGTTPQSPASDLGCGTVSGSLPDGSDGAGNLNPIQP